MVTHDISEAISLADKIVVLSNRPAIVKDIFDIKFNEKNPLERRSSPKFSEYYTKIWRDIDE